MLLEHKIANQSVEDNDNTTTYQVLPVHNLRWMVTNIRDGDVSKGTTLWEYSFLPQMEKEEDILLVYALLLQNDVRSSYKGFLPKSCTKYR